MLIPFLDMILTGEDNEEVITFPVALTHSITLRDARKDALGILVEV